MTWYKKNFQAKGGKSSFGPSQNKKDDFAIGGFSLDVSFFGIEIHKLCNNASAFDWFREGVRSWLKVRVQSTRF